MYLSRPYEEELSGKDDRTPEHYLCGAVIGQALHDAFGKSVEAANRVEALGWLTVDDRPDEPAHWGSFRWWSEWVFNDAEGFRRLVRKMIASEDPELQYRQLRSRRYYARSKKGKL